MNGYTLGSIRVGPLERAFSPRSPNQLLAMTGELLVANRTFIQEEKMRARLRVLSIVHQCLGYWWHIHPFRGVVGWGMLSNCTAAQS